MDLLYCIKLYCADTQRWPVFETNYIAPIFHICHIYFLINSSWKLLSSIWKSRFIFLVKFKMKKIRNVVSCNLQHLFIVFLLRLLSTQIISRMVQIRLFKSIAVENTKSIEIIFLPLFRITQDIVILRRKIFKKVYFGNSRY